MEKLDGARGCSEPLVPHLKRAFLAYTLLLEEATTVRKRYLCLYKAFIRSLLRTRLILRIEFSKSSFDLSKLKRNEK